jgi:glutaminyl-peptide cyclotransferase
MKIVALLATPILILSACNNTPTPTADVPVAITDNSNIPTNIPYTIVNTYPHDTGSFTEGLQYVNGKIYESAGNYGQSDIRITEPNTGKVLKAQKLAKEFFGEGLTVLGNKAYQLTYQENTAFVYDATTLKQINKFTYNFGEGWGMTTDGTNLIISTGSSNIYFVDPATFKVLKSIGIYNQYGSVDSINELEFINGFIYANQWRRDHIFKIDPANGKVVGIINLEDLRAKYNYPPYDQVEKGMPGPEALNGIAYDSVKNKIYITGKNWPLLFEVKFDN